MRTIQEILEEKKFSFKDNRSFIYRAMNKAIEFGFEILVVEKGMVCELKSGFKWNIAIKIPKWNIQKVFYFKAVQRGGDISGSILHAISATYKAAKEKGLTDVEIIHPCSKCSARGYIPGFSHIANGICFDCMGSGSDWRATKAAIEELAKS